MLIDTHCHLDYDSFDADRGAMRARARAAGVSTMITIGTTLKGFDRVRAIAEADPDIWCTVGVHPHEADGEPVDEAGALVAEAAHPKVAGIGETGLDFYYDHSDRGRQEANFRAHIAAARETGLPVVIHTRDADEAMAGILEEEMKRGPFTGLLHCFSSGRALAERALALGLYISFSGIVTFKKSDELRAIARDVPADRLLVETDAPYLAPVPHRGKRNEPAFVVHTAEVLADTRGEPFETLAAQTTENALRLFSRVRPAR